MNDYTILENLFKNEQYEIHFELLNYHKYQSVQCWTMI